MENLSKLADTDVDARRILHRLATTKGDEYIKALQTGLNELAGRLLDRKG